MSCFLFVVFCKHVDDYNALDGDNTKIKPSMKNNPIPEHGNTQTERFNPFFNLKLIQVCLSMLT